MLTAAGVVALFCVSVLAGRRLVARDSGPTEEELHHSEAIHSADIHSADMHRSIRSSIHSADIHSPDEMHHSDADHNSDDQSELHSAVHSAEMHSKEARRSGVNPRHSSRAVHSLDIHSAEGVHSAGSEWRAVGDVRWLPHVAADALFKTMIAVRYVYI